MSGDAGQEFSAHLERWEAVGGALLDTRQREPKVPHDVEADCAFAHGLAAIMLSAGNSFKIGPN